MYNSSSSPRHRPLKKSRLENSEESWLYLSDADFRAEIRERDTSGSYMRALTYLQFKEEENNSISFEPPGLEDWLGYPHISRNNAVESYLAETRAGAAAERRLSRICAEHENRLRDIFETHERRITPSPSDDEIKRISATSEYQPHSFFEQNQQKHIAVTGVQDRYLSQKKKSSSSYKRPHHASINNDDKLTSSLATTVPDEDSLSDVSANHAHEAGEQQQNTKSSWLPFSKQQHLSPSHSIPQHPHNSPDSSSDGEWEDAPSLPMLRAAAAFSTTTASSSHRCRRRLLPSSVGNFLYPPV
uniref:Uncharacterized protein n=1 Tax=Aureoumbra lagunensis TaxID=44058 RepID=A0A7S3NKE9_9STRA